MTSTTLQAAASSAPSRSARDDAFLITGEGTEVVGEGVWIEVTDRTEWQIREMTDDDELPFPD